MREDSVEIVRSISSFSRAFCFTSIFFLVACTAWGAEAKPETPTDLQKQIIGAWEIVSDGDGNPPPQGFEGQISFIGDKHWTALRPDPATKKLSFVLGGTYTLKGDELVETVEYGNDEVAELVGQKFTFKLKLDGEKLILIGVGNPYSQTLKRAK